MKKRKKLKFNSDKALRNFMILANIISISYLIFKIATQGISWLSPIGYFG